MLKLAIAGIGSIAHQYIRLICDGQTPDVQITALCSRNPATLDEVRQLHPQLKDAAVFTDYAQLLRSGAAEAVLISTPHSQHPAMALSAVEAGLHVLTEKPVGIFPEDVEKVLRALETRPELKAGVLFNRRASTAFQKLHQLVQEGFVDEPVRVTWLLTNLYRSSFYYGSAPWRGTWEGEGGGVLINQAAHQLDLLQWLWGMPESLYARCSTVGREMEVENEAELLMTFPGGSHGQFIASAHEAPGSNRLELCGTKGRLVLTDDRELEMTTLAQDELIFSRQCTELFAKPASTTERLSFPPMADGAQQAATIQNFAEAVAGTAPLNCTLSDGLRSLKLIRAAYASQRSGAAVTL